MAPKEAAHVCVREKEFSELATLKERMTAFERAAETFRDSMKDMSALREALIKFLAESPLKFALREDVMRLEAKIASSVTSDDFSKFKLEVMELFKKQDLNWAKVIGGMAVAQAFIAVVWALALKIYFK